MPRAGAPTHRRGLRLPGLSQMPGVECLACVMEPEEQEVPIGWPSLMEETVQ